jgi:hypothetical protein
MPRRKRRRSQSRISKFQRKVAEIFRIALGESYMRYEVSWSWLVNEDGNRLYVDIYFPRFGLAVEAHGIQHFKYPNHFHKTYEEYERQRHNDQTKKRLLREHGVKYIAVREQPKPTVTDANKLLDSVGIGPDYVPTYGSDVQECTDSVDRKLQRAT